MEHPLRGCVPAAAVVSASMANIPEIVIFTALAAAALLPLWWSWRFVSLYLVRRESSATVGELPPAAVILALRGADPSLIDCLNGLLRQVYPRYVVRIVIDSREDPAWNVVHDILAQHPPGQLDVQVSVLENRHESCGLKVSAQLQAIAGLDPSIEVVALIDGDVTPGPGWLRSLAAPLADPHVGAACGVRWYAPADTRLGSLVRNLWNAAACTQMAAYRIPWGGSLALPARVF